MVRRETSADGRQEEVLCFYARKQPWSVRFTWLAGEGEGREVFYVKGQYENKIHVVLAAADVPLLPAGHKMALSLDSPLVKKASRTPITEAGIGPMIDRFGRVLDAADRGDFHLGRVTVLGVQERPDYGTPLLMVEERLPANADPDVPRGGRWLLGIHPEQHLPVLSVLYDNTGNEVDYYRFDRLQLDVHLNDTDFDPGPMGRRAAPR